ncbi:hypothetical protein BGZ93_002944 [Podila epicladia]|nr:hypothetical protein BGZ92_003625 [Podila epicladia]KAG0097344.1 hypothetical protein BGZ93_002944 [Podila epicladia]
MHYFKIITSLALALMPSSVEATPLLLAPSDSVATGPYVPLSERIFTAEQHDEHERILKRSSIGWNDWNCRPKPGKKPLVMVHGLGSNAYENFNYMAPRFAAAGYCGYTISYGFYRGIPLLGGLNDMAVSAQELSNFVDKVLNATGASKVNIFGHSEGSIVPRYYLKFLGGAAKVEKFAAMGPVVTGSILQGLVPFLTGLGLYDPIKKVIDPVCLSCFQVLDNSPFLQALNAQGDTVPGVSYKFIASKADLLVTPYTAGFLRGNNPLVENVTLQDLCPVDLSGHIALCLDPIVFHSVRAFFDPTAPQNIGCLDALR